MTTIAFRADETTERELDELATAAAVERSAAIRAANDPAGQAELRRIMAELDEISAW